MFFISEERIPELRGLLVADCGCGTGHQCGRIDIWQRHRDAFYVAVVVTDVHIPAVFMRKSVAPVTVLNMGGAGAGVKRTFGDHEFSGGAPNSGKLDFAGGGDRSGPCVINIASGSCITRVHIKGGTVKIGNVCSGYIWCFAGEHGRTLIETGIAMDQKVAVRISSSDHSIIEIRGVHQVGFGKLQYIVAAGCSFRQFSCFCQRR